MEFSIGIAKLLLFFVLCIASQSGVQAEKQAIVTALTSRVTEDNGVVTNMTSRVVDGMIDAIIDIKQDTMGAVTVEIGIYIGETLANGVTKDFPHPMQDFGDYNLCGSMDFNTPEDDTYSMAEGEQSVTQCDPSSCLTDLDPGDYTIKINVKLGNAIIIYIEINVTIIETEESE